MTKEDALNLLNATEKDSSEQILEKFNQLYSEYQIRLTNAPTPNLKKLYQKNIQELEEARDALVSGSVGSKGNLPSAVPVFEEGKTASGNQAGSPLVSTTTPPAKKPVASNQAKKTPFLWMIVSLAMGCVAILLMILLFEKHSSYNRLESEYSTLLGKVVVNQDSIEQVSSELNHWRATFSNQKLSLKNLGSREITVHGVVVVYLDENNNLKKHEQLLNNMKIRPGGGASFSLVQGGRTVWDGSAIFYCFDVSYLGAHFLYGGYLSPGDSPVLNMDNF
jgi:hypothetical protein